MTHTHKFKEVELSLSRLRNVTHWRCIECNEVWITDNGDEESLPGEILLDEFNSYEPSVRSLAQIKASKKNGMKSIKKFKTPWREHCVLTQKG